MDMGAEATFHSCSCSCSSADQDKNKKKRRHRRSRQNSPLSGSACDSVNNLPRESSECFKMQSPQAHTSASDDSPLGSCIVCGTPVLCKTRMQEPYDISLDHTPPITVTGNQNLYTRRGFQNQTDGPPGYGGEISMSHMVQNSPSGAECLGAEKDCRSGNQLRHIGQRMFVPHWSSEAMTKALAKGDVFKAVFHVNAHNRFEAYCKIDGVHVDILMDGLAAQNRAVEGDIVVIQVDPVLCWTRMKGSSTQSVASAIPKEPDSISTVNEKVNLSVKGKTNRGLADDIERGIKGMHISSEKSTYLSSTTTFSTIPCDGSNLVNPGLYDEQIEALQSLRKICCDISSSPFKRPTGKVVAILDKSSRRDSIIGHLGAKEWFQYVDWYRSHFRNSSFSLSDLGIEVTPVDPRFSKMIVPVRDLPTVIQKRLLEFDVTVEKEIVGVKIDAWGENSHLPMAQVISMFGRAGEIETHVASILFENNICCSEFSAESISCIPCLPWSIPKEELHDRRDLRDQCIFTIDPPMATELDDALSIENLPEGDYRVGVHIADVSYFVLPETSLDMDAQQRSTSVYMVQRKLPMLPPLLSENLGSLNPGVDRLAFSIIWDISPTGTIKNRWIGRTLIHSCCKFSYGHAQDIITSENPDTATYPILHGLVQWPEVISSIKSLNQLSKVLKGKRFNDGALRLDGPKLSYVFDEFGIPCDSMVSERCDANFLVEEFMLLANKTAAEIISLAYPEFALLRRHPEPNMRKLKEFESFCSKHGLEIDISTSGQLHQSLERIKGQIQDDAVLFDIIINYATKPMQLASYFCSGDKKISVDEWGHYTLAVPMYTHFTSPLRRYPDVVVHRTLAAVIEAENILSEQQRLSSEISNERRRCFTGLSLVKNVADSVQRQEALTVAALKYKLPCTDSLGVIASRSNERKMASKNVEDACHRLYMWVLLKNKQVLVSEARVLGLGPKFMSIYVQKFAIERRIYYDEVEGLIAEWLNATSTLVLSSTLKRLNKKGTPSKWRPLEDVALVVNTTDCNTAEKDETNGQWSASLGMPRQNALHTSFASCRSSDFEPPALPLTIRVFSTIPVALFAVGGEDGPLEIKARLFFSSYFG